MKKRFLVSLKIAVLLVTTIVPLGAGPVFSQPFFYETEVSPNGGGTVTRAIVSTADTEIVENYVATPSEGYVFSSWVLYPWGVHHERSYIHSYDPTLFYTQEIKIITANFVKSDIMTGPNNPGSPPCLEVNVDLSKANQIEIAFASADGSTCSIQGSMDLETWYPVESGIVSGGHEVKRMMQIRGGMEFFRLISDSKESGQSPDRGEPSHEFAGKGFLN